MLPPAIAESEKFTTLEWGNQKFLFDLYLVIGDCERFTIDMSKPQEYRQKPGVNLSRRISALVAAGLLEVVGKQKNERSHYNRVFTFAQPDSHPADSGANIQPQHNLGKIQ